MKQEKIVIKRALISVSDKEGIAEFARGLMDLNIEIISTGGTSLLLRDAGVQVHDVSDVTLFPEIMGGRVKTLHPKVHGGILGKRDTHDCIARQHEIDWIDLVIVNLYPFAETVKNPAVTFDAAIENIDIGGPAMIRSAAKNMEWVGVVVDPNDYQTVLAELRAQATLSPATRKSLATKAFAHTANYDSLIHRYLDNLSATSPQQDAAQTTLFPATLGVQFEKVADLRYGENPHQTACAYRNPAHQAGILSAHQHQGKQLSFNNIADADAAVAAVREFTQPACVIVKHANPCGAAVANDIHTAFQHAFHADAQSAFGGIVALNQTCTEAVATAISQIFIEVLIAPDYTPQALAILASKPNLRILALDSLATPKSGYDMKFISGGLLIQDQDTALIQEADLQFVTQLKPSAHDIQTMLFAWRVLKHIKSNAILIAKEDVTVGIGAGQVSRVDAVDIALRKAGSNLSGAILASDAFFPFRDSIDHLANSGIRAIIQPGGSVRDEEVIAACHEHNIAMVFTAKRCFKH